jgi:Ca-activated chloride channel family protein
MNLVLVLDTSGSMGSGGIDATAPIMLEQAAVRALASQLGAGDVISAVTWNTAQSVALDKHVASGPDDPAVIALADGLTADGGTDLDSGLAKGYALAEQAFDPSRINRVVVISDGQANVGQTSGAMIGAKAEDKDREAIYLVGVGVGDGVNDTLMDAVTDAGRGAYVYLDTPAEATAMLAGRFDEVMDVSARGVQVEMELPWYFQMKQFFGEEYSSDPTVVKPQHLAPGDAMIFQQIVTACSGQAISASDSVKVTARWTDPFDYSQKSVTTARSFAEMTTASSRELLRGRAIVKWAESLKLSSSAALAALDDALASADASDPGRTDPQLNEIRALAVKIRPRL